MKYIFILSGVLFMMLPITVSGGSIDSPAGPDDSGSAMYKVDDIYNRLNSGAAGAKRSGAFAGPVSGPGSASRTLDEVMGVAPATDDTNGAGTGDVLSGRTFWGLTSGQWGPQTGAMPNSGAFALSCGAWDQGVTAGYYSGGTLAGDGDLVGTNIKSGVDIFGVTGTVIESSGDAVAGDVLTGKTFSNAGAAGVSGTMADNGAVSMTPGTSAQTVTAGYHNGSGTVAGDADLIGTNIKSSVDIFGVTGTVIESSGDAVAGDVLTGKTFSNAGAAGVSGTMADNGAVSMTPGTSAQTVTAGYHNGSGTVAGDTDLAVGNIKSGVDIFGVTGTATVAAYPTIVPKTGQTPTVPIAASTGSDGNLQRGVSWPNPRFTDNSNGTVTDNLTGLIWLKNANCANAQRDWATALADVTQINTNGTMNSNNCGDTSNAGSFQTDWRLPNYLELISLIDLRYDSPSVSNTAGTGQWTEGQPFSGVQLSYYWSGSTFAGNTSYAWYVDMYDGYAIYNDKTITSYVWPVRGGQ